MLYIYSALPQAEEVFSFAQEDLISDAVMLLDTFTEVFVWLGRETSQKLRDNAMKTALEYVKKVPHPDSVCTYVVQQGSEPPPFQACFRGWNPDIAQKFDDPYQVYIAFACGL